jgi:molybdenum transport protein
MHLYHCVLSDAEAMALLRDDAPFGDLTTETLGIGEVRGLLTFLARQAMIVCGVEEAARLVVLAGASPRVLCPSGSPLSDGEPLLEARGAASALHRAWKAAQVLVEWASGIATGTSAIVAAARGLPVACTRKHVPGGCGPTTPPPMPRRGPTSWSPRLLTLPRRGTLP